MSDAEDRDRAERKIVLYGQTAVYPTLDAEEIDDILNDCQVASTWTAETGYAVNAVVQPTRRNGHRYKAIEVSDDSQSSAATEPTWPTGRDSTVTDGGITWQEAGAEYASVYDYSYGVFLVWQAKYAKAAGCNVDFKTAAGNAMSGSQILTHINAQILRWTPIRI